jgi:(heptosyl)LPS beta-1,4-glucosyltransferase
MRIRDYALLWAKQEAKKDKKSSKTEAILRAIWRFFRAYVIKAGFLDGKLGFKIACSCAMEVYLKYMALAILLRHKIGRTGING